MGEEKIVVDRYKTVKKLIDANYIKDFTEIFSEIAYTKVAKDIGFAADRMKVMITPAGVIKWSLGDLIILARKFDISEEKILSLVLATYIAKKDKIKLPIRKPRK